jgi:hypothetical protein
MDRAGMGYLDLVIGGYQNMQFGRVYSKRRDYGYLPTVWEKPVRKRLSGKWLTRERAWSPVGTRSGRTVWVRPRGGAGRM